MADTSIFYMIILAISGVLMPIMGVFNGPKVRELLDTSPEKKITIYTQTILMLIILGGLVLIALFVNKDSLQAIGAGFLTDVKSTSMLVALCLCFLLIFNLLKPNKRLLERLENSFQKVMYLMPETAREYRAGILMSFAAGFSEEILFRGFMFNQLLLYMPVSVSLLVVNVIFGLCHWGTGLKNAFWSFVLGISWSLLYLATDSLWVPVLTHVVVDLFSLTFGYRIKQLSTPPSSNRPDSHYQAA